MHRHTIEYEERRAAYLFLSPALVAWAVFLILPAFAAVYYSFTKYSILRPPIWIGVENYIHLVQDQVFLQSLLNTVIYTFMYVPGKIVLSLLLALLLNERFVKPRGLFLGAYYIPVITSMAAASYIWLWIYQPDAGILNGLLGYLGIPHQQWIYASGSVLPSISMVTIWKDFGMSVVLFVAGLQSIPSHLYEAAIVEGANSWQRFWKITLPLLMPVFLLVLVTSIIMSFQVFTAIIIMTQGGPAFSSTTIVHQIYLNAFAYLHMGRAAAMSFVLLIIISLLSIPQFQRMRKNL